MPNLVHFLQRQKAKKLGVRFVDLGKMSMDSYLIMEQTSRLGDIRVRLPDSNQPLTMGAYSYIREGGEISHLKSIGRFCSIGRNVVLGQQADNHPISWVSSSMSVSGEYVADIRYAVIGHDVWIGHDAVVMAGVKLGNGSVVGRNAVVTRDVNPYEIVAGNPAKPIKYRFTEEQIAALQASEWWNIERDSLVDLPFDDVDKFLAGLDKNLPIASYKKFTIRNRKISSQG